MVFLKEFFEKVDFEKNQQMTKNMKNFPGGNQLRDDYSSNIYLHDPSLLLAAIFLKYFQLLTSCKQKVELLFVTITKISVSSIHYTYP